MTAIKKLHHAAYRCRDSEETRTFYEDFLGLPLVAAVEIGTTKTGRAARVLHTFFAMADGSALAFFDAPEEPFEFVDRRDFDLHIALEVDRATLLEKFEAGKRAGVETRGISDHGFIESIYFRDPNGYVVELAAPKRPGGGFDAESGRRAREALRRWQAGRAEHSQASAEEEMS